MEAVGFTLMFLTGILCHKAIRYNNGTEGVLKEYEELMKKNLCVEGTPAP